MYLKCWRLQVKGSRGDEKKPMMICSVLGVFSFDDSSFIIYLVCNYLYMQVYSQALENNCSRLLISQSHQTYFWHFWFSSYLFITDYWIRVCLTSLLSVFYFLILVLISTAHFLLGQLHTHPLVLRLSFLTFVLSWYVRSFYATRIEWLQNPVSILFSAVKTLLLLQLDMFIWLPYCLQNFPVCLKSKSSSRNKILVLVVSLAVYCHSSLPSLKEISDQFLSLTPFQFI